MDSSGEIGKLKAEIEEVNYRLYKSTVTPKNGKQKYKPIITPPRRRGAISTGEDHLETEARVHRM